MGELKAISDVRELRIDNLVLNNHKELHRISINDFSVYRHPQMGGDYGLYAILLTEDWILKFGFTKWESSRYGNKYTIGIFDWGFTIENSFDKGKWFFGHEYYDSPHENENYKSMNFCFDLKYVHQLQNIFFALKGEELTISHES